MRRNDVAYHRQRAGEDRDSGFSARRGERKRIGFPHRILRTKLPLDVVPLHPLPVAVADLPQPVAGHRFEAAMARDDASSLYRARERAGIHGGDVLRRQTLTQARSLPSALLRELGAGRSGEAILLRRRRRTVPYEE